MAKLRTYDRTAGMQTLMDLSLPQQGTASHTVTELQDMGGTRCLVIGEAEYIHIISDHEDSEEPNAEPSCRLEALGKKPGEVRGHLRRTPPEVPEIGQSRNHRFWRHPDTLIFDREPPRIVLV